MTTLRIFRCIPIFALFFCVACSSGPRLEGLASNELGKNQYFDRLNEFANFGSDSDYFALLGYNFEDATELLMSTNHFDFGGVPINYLKSRRFTVLNPYPKPIEGVQPRIDGSPFFHIVKSTCGAVMKGHQICTFTVKFHPVTKSAKHNAVGRHQATLTVNYVGGDPLVKPLSGSAILR